MFALVSGAPSAFRMASDHAFWFSPLGVSYSAVACGVSPPESTDEGEGDVVVGAVVAGVGVAVLGFGDALWVGAGIFAVLKPSGLALAWSSELRTDGTAARVAASSGLPGPRHPPHPPPGRGGTSADDAMDGADSTYPG